MKYAYLPDSYAPHYASIRDLFEPVPTPVRTVVLDSAEVPPADAPPLLRAVVAAGGWARCIRALAEDVATCNLIESVSVRVRHNGVGGYAMWINGRAAGAAAFMPYRKLSHEALQVELGLIVIRTDTCPRCWRQGVRLNIDGTLRAHKTPQGGKCTATI